MLVMPWHFDNNSAQQMVLKLGALKLVAFCLNPIALNEKFLQFLKQYKLIKKLEWESEYWTSIYYIGKGALVYYAINKNPNWIIQRQSPIFLLQTKSIFQLSTCNYDTSYNSQTTCHHFSNSLFQSVQTVSPSRSPGGSMERL